MKNVPLYVLIAILICVCGCNMMAIIAPLATPTSAEIKIPADYNLKQALDINEPNGHKRKGRLLVMVEHKDHPRQRTQTVYYLTEALNVQLVKKAGIDAKKIIGYRSLAAFNNSISELAKISPVDTGKALNADKVLMVTIVDYQLYELSGSGYYNGSLAAKASIYDVNTGQVVWPQAEQAMRLKVGFDMQSGQGDSALKRLAASAAHCVVRCLYDCPKNQYKIMEDKPTGY